MDQRKRFTLLEFSAQSGIPISTLYALSANRRANRLSEFKAVLSIGRKVYWVEENFWKWAEAQQDPEFRVHRPTRPSPQCRVAKSKSEGIEQLRVSRPFEVEKCGGSREEDE